MLPHFSLCWPSLACLDLIFGICCALYLGMTLMPFDSLTGKSVMNSIPHWGVGGFDLRASTQAAYIAARPFHIFNSYGLFRRMTGVGPADLRKALTPAADPHVRIRIRIRIPIRT